MHVQEESCSFILGTYCSSWLPDDTGAPDVFGVKVLCPRQKAGGKSTAVLSGGHWHSGLYIRHGGEISHLTFSLCHSLICLYFSHTCAPFLTFSLSFTHTHPCPWKVQTVGLSGCLAALNGELECSEESNKDFKINATYVVDFRNFYCICVYIYIIFAKAKERQKPYISVHTMSCICVCLIIIASPSHIWKGHVLCV